jgi:hypothetical protein
MARGNEYLRVLREVSGVIRLWGHGLDPEGHQTIALARRYQVLWRVPLSAPQVPKNEQQGT